MSSRTRLIAWPIIVLLAVLFITRTSGGQSAVQYFYDQLGRLVGVIDTSGNAAGYNYDAVGNLLSISRYTSSQVSALDFTPTSGPVGTVVTISGTGYSATLSQDTVSFNGKTATITSATVNQLIVTVPTGATTGTIKVTTPSGNFTTTTNFTVATNSGAPAITSFTPVVATPGTAISITGTNFNTTPANDQLRFNLSRQFATSSTSTVISASTPTGTSGHVQVSTSAGTALSTQDLYVPFGTHTAAQVGYSQRTTLGSSATVSLGTAGQIGLLIFDASAGQRISLSLSNMTFATCITVYLFAPDGTELSTLQCPAASGFVDAVAAPYTGTYTVGIDTLSPETGSVTVTPNNASDVTGTITIGGSPVTMTNSVPGQNISLTFPSSAGRVVSLMTTNATFPDYATLFIYSPDGPPIGPSSSVNSSGPFFIGATTLGYAGTYKIYIAPEGTDTGKITTTLYNATPVTGTITAGGSAVTATTTVPGQNAQYTFTGTANERVSLAIQNVSYSSSFFFNPAATVSIIEPNGKTLASVGVYNLLSGIFFIDVQIIPTTGTYNVQVAPGPYTGSAVLNLYNVPADAGGTISIGGSAVVVTTTTPGQNAYLTFPGSSGQSVTLTGSNVTYTGNTSITLYNPDGSVLTTSYAYPGGNTIFSGVSLVQTGTYKIYIDPYQANTGQVTLQLTSP
jgi:YD repeat-containing protein